MRNRVSKQTSKRKAETNFVPAYSGASVLAPPPTSKDVSAVPAKLRRMMELKVSMSQGTSNRPQFDGRSGRGQSLKAMKLTKTNATERKAKATGLWSAPVAPVSGQDIETGLSSGFPEQPAKKQKGAFASKWKKGEEELKMLIEKMDKRTKTAVRAGVGERKRSYLKEKKNKKKGRGKNPDEDTLPSLHKYEKVEFGDIVQAPPKLSFPRKAAEVKLKESLKGEQGVSQERLRLGAIDAYRQRKVWKSRPGQQLPVLAHTSNGGPSV